MNKSVFAFIGGLSLCGVFAADGAAQAAPVHEISGSAVFSAKPAVKAGKLRKPGGNIRQKGKIAPRNAGRSGGRPLKRAAFVRPSAGAYYPHGAAYHYAGGMAGRPYAAEIHQAAKRYNLPDDLIHAIVHTESNYNYRMRGSVGEVGLMQIRPSTARLIGYQGSVRDLYNPSVNLEYGTRYLAYARDLSGGSLCGTVLKYNAGLGAKRMNPISARYCRNVENYLYAAGWH